MSHSTPVTTTTPRWFVEIDHTDVRNPHLSKLLILQAARKNGVVKRELVPDGDIVSIDFQFELKKNAQYFAAIVLDYPTVVSVYVYEEGRA